MKKFYLWLVWMLMITLCLSSGTAETTDFAMVNTKKGPLNIWKRPDGETSLARIPKGETVLILEKGDEWTLIEYEGVSGYVNTQYLQFTGGDAAEKDDPTSDIVGAEEKSSEIVFQNIPWGASIVDVERLLKEQGATNDNYDVDTRVESLSYGPNTGHMTEQGLGCRIWDFGVPSQYRIAGYSVDSLFAYCYYDYEEAKVHRDAASSHFILIELELSVTNADVAFSDLSAKLSSLYGIETVLEDSTGWISSGGNYDTHETWSVWKGDNNTAVVLYQEKDIMRSDSSITKNKLTLAYGKTDMLSVLQELTNADYQEKVTLEQEVIERNADDLGGL